MKPEPIHESTGLQDINYKISTFIKSFTLVLYVIMGFSVVGVLLKLYTLPGGSYLFVVSMGLLTLMFLVQVGLSFFYVVSNIKLALLGAFSSLALALGYLSIIFKYQDWWGWQILFFIVIPIFLATMVVLCFFIFGKNKQKPQHQHFLIRNLVVPYCLLLVLGILSFIVSEEDFLYRHRYKKAKEAETSIEADSTASFL